MCVVDGALLVGGEGGEKTCVWLMVRCWWGEGAITCCWAW